jgi:hypothetical protein
MEDASGGREVHVRLGDLVSAQQITIVITVQCPAVNAGAGVSVSARLANRDHALFAQPMTIDWTAVDADANAAQPVNSNGACAFGDQSPGLDEDVGGPGLREIEALAVELEADEPDYAMHMAPMALKARHFASDNHSVGRSATGKARR